MTTSPPAAQNRSQVLRTGREAAFSRRRADSKRCRDRVTVVIEQMQRARTPLSDAEITRRAQVNPQYLQRHRDLKIEAQKVRAALLDDANRQAAALQAETEQALLTENAVLVEQSALLRRDLDTARTALSEARAQELSSAATGVLAGRVAPDAAVTELQRQLDETRAALRTAEADLTALRNLNQRLMIENSRLLDAQSGDR
jgi:hypothetical protein